MPIYEYYCPKNHTVYQFFAKTLAQGKTIPPCPANPSYPMVKRLSAFAIGGGVKKDEEAAAAPEGAAEDDPRLDSAMATMEKEFDRLDENDPRALAHMMRRMAELTGEKIEGEAEEVVRKLEEGTDPEALDEAMGGDVGEEMGEGEETAPAKEQREARQRLRSRLPPRRDPQLYDYP